VILPVVGALAVAAALAGAYYAGHQAGANKVEAAAAREERLVAAAGQQAASAAAAAISTIKVRHVTVQQQLEREVRERTVYSECRSGPDAVRMFNAAIPGADAGPAAAGGGELPASAAAR
jgi:hypothetical protein